MFPHDEKRLKGKTGVPQMGWPHQSPFPDMVHGASHLSNSGKEA